MIWTAPTEKDTGNTALEKRLWDAADQLRANSGLKSQGYSGDPARELAIPGVEKTEETGRLCRLNKIP